MSISGLARLRPLALQLGDEESLLIQALERLHDLDEGEIGVLPELVAWTNHHSAIAFGTLLTFARDHGIGVITTLNLPPDLTEDLPGRDPAARHNAVVVMTRHGDVHVPQAKLTPQAFERSQAPFGPGIGVAPYARLNRVRLDLGDEVVSAHFLVCSDLWVLTRLPPPSLRCDLLVVPANFARGAEVHAGRLLAAARARGIAGATILVNPGHQPRDPSRAPLAIAVETLLDDGAGAVAAAWDDRALLDDCFRICDDDRVPNFVAMVELPEREGRIAVPRSLADAPIAPGEYPVTIVL
ncbi:MAG: hypothetical protein EXR72_09745 [Myxococcales bacterium]|nr:hypothetical protein [Myxococcales bacterium]